MDRLSTVILSLAVLCGCKSEQEGAASTGRSRVNAVPAKPAEAMTPEEFCDVLHEPGQGPEVVSPPLAEGAAMPLSSGFHWINLWATWCKPCIEEIPRLSSWAGNAEAPFALTLLSADESADSVTSFREAHPNISAGPRLASLNEMESWLTSLGVMGASLPIHLLVGPDGRLRCARAGGVSESDHAAVVGVVTR